MGSLMTVSKNRFINDGAKTIAKLTKVSEQIDSLLTVSKSQIALLGKVSKQSLNSRRCQNKSLNQRVSKLQIASLKTVSKSRIALLRKVSKQIA